MNEESVSIEDVQNEDANGRHDRTSVQEYLNDPDRNWEEVEEITRAVLDGEVPSCFQDEADIFFLGMLKWAMSRSPNADLQWAAIVDGTSDERLKDRDGYVARLWSETTSLGRLDKLWYLIEKRWQALEVYRRYLFRWFLSRFNLADALGVYVGFLDRRKRGTVSNRMATLTFLLVLAVLSVRIAAMTFTWGGVDILSGVVLAVAMAGLVSLSAVLVRGKPSLPAVLFFEALMPRLGAAVGVGYLFLAAGIHLPRAVYRWEAEPHGHWTLVGLLLVAVYVYVALHISRRVQPPLALREILARSATVVAVGVMYAVAGLAFAGPALFSESLFVEPLPQEAGLHHLFLIATVALVVGMVLQLAWDERPMTDPL